MSADTWTALARQHGRKCVMSLGIDEATLDAETERQWGEIEALLRPRLGGSKVFALDYGCGYGRFSPRLAKMAGCTVIAYDPCAELLAGATRHPGVHYVLNLRPYWHYDLIFVAMVLGDPNVDIEATAAELSSLLSPNGLLCVLEHMTPKDRWWQFRPFATYRELFARHGVELVRIGHIAQLTEDVSVCVGRQDLIGRLF